MLRSLFCLTVGAVCVGSAAGQSVFPPLPQVAQNLIPFGVDTNSTLHQVFRAGLFGAVPVNISRIAFSPGTLGVYNSDVTIRLGYTDRTPGAAPPGGLDIPTAGGGGTPNATGPMSVFFTDPVLSRTITITGPEAWTEMTFDGSFDYDPNQGNLLLEVVSNAVLGQSSDLAVSRCGGSADASRSYTTTRFGAAANGATATRVQFTFAAGPTCYPDCNGDGALNLADFGCFTTKFALGDPYADCNADTVLNLADFGCFTTRFALGCP